MGLFSVWVKLNGYQRLVTFVNREAADEWWRTISTPPSIHAEQIKRISPQLYIQNGGKDLWYSFNDVSLQDQRHFYERMLFAQSTGDAEQRATAIMAQPNEVTDHISGRWYFIRSKADPFSHWYLRTSGTCAVCGYATCEAIHVSSDYRTRFCIRVRGVAQVPEDFVMIGKDEISILASKEYTVHISDAGDMKATKKYQGEVDLIFSDLKNRFVARAERQVNGEVWEYVESVDRGVGEVWELAE